MTETTMTKQSRLAVGDEGTIVWRHARTADMPARVVKVGRKWATLDQPLYAPARCDIETGRLDGGNYSSPGTFYTPEALAHRKRLIEANETITEHGISFKLSARWADEDVLALAAWLREMFE